MCTRTWSRSTDVPSLLKMSHDPYEEDDDDDEVDKDAEKIRYLGSGEDAIVHPGCVLVKLPHAKIAYCTLLYHFKINNICMTSIHYFTFKVAPGHEFDHFLMKSAVYIYAIGLDDNEDMVIRGVIIDHSTAFTIAEMSPNVMGEVSTNLIFCRRRNGNDSAML